jgi:hypothetical protein
MDTETEHAPLEPKPKRKYKPRRVCTDPDLKYLYKPKPGPKPGKSKRKRYEPERTDAEKRQFSRRSRKMRKVVETNPAVREVWSRHIVEISKTNPAKLSRYGIPDGMNREQADAAWAVARAQAEKVFTQMVDDGIIADVSPEDFERVLIQRGDELVQILVPKTDAGKASVAFKELMVVAWSDHAADKSCKRNQHRAQVHQVAARARRSKSVRRKTCSGCWPLPRTLIKKMATTHHAICDLRLRFTQTFL